MMRGSHAIGDAVWVAKLGNKRRALTVHAGVVAVLMLLPAAPAVAEEEGGWNNAFGKPVKWRWKPELSVGSAWTTDQNIVFTAASSNLLSGLSKLEISGPESDGVFIAGSLPVALTERLTLVVDGRWTFLGEGYDATEAYNDGFGRRDWASAGWGNIERRKNGLGTADLMLSYALPLRISGVREIAPVIGIRWDYADLLLDTPRNVVNINNAPGDTVEMKTHSYAPVLGVNVTFAGPKIGNLGGDIRLSIMASPWLRGRMSYNEYFNGGFNLAFGEADIRGSMYTFTGALGLYSKKLAGHEASLDLTVRYSRIRLHDTVPGRFSVGGFVIGNAPYRFSSENNVMSVGLAASVAF